MSRLVRFCALALVLAACSGRESATHDDISSSEVRPDLAACFAEVHADAGAFVLYDRNADRYIRVDSARCATRFLPASTFKIFNSLVALETGVASDENFTLAWDSVDRGNPEWNQDQDMKSAFRRSAVWYYQELARRIGETRMRSYVEREHYGNADISGGIDRFWLKGALRISPDEQVELLRKLHDDRLSFSKRSMRIVREIMLRRDTLGYRMYEKTGWGEPDGRQIGWIVGWVERDSNVYYFASNIESRDSAFPMIRARREATDELLRRVGALPR